MRHAQSLENIKITALVDGVTRLQNFRLPTIEQVMKSISLLHIDMDSPVSALGKNQIIDAATFVLGCDFLTRFKVDLVAYSPLIRAKDTCLTVFDSHSDSTIVLEHLKEATPYEQLIRSTTVTQRIARFERWLSLRDEDTILVVGHSQFFKRLLKTDNLMRNCDIWRSQVIITSDSSGLTDQTTFHWSELELLFRTPLALPSSFETPQTDGGLGQSSGAPGEDSCCRICQVRSGIHRKEGT